MKVILTHGIPASGKTTYLKSIKNTDYIDLDYKPFKQKELKESLIQQLHRVNGNKLCCIDILLTTNKDLLSIINDIKSVKPDSSVEVISFSLDREQSLLNDRYRNRSTCAEVTIKNIPYEIIDKSLFKDLNINFIYKDTYKLTETELKALELDVYIRDGRYFYSDSWCLGGESWNCWGDKWNVSSEDPLEFDEFDKILEDLCPDITLLKYKKIKKECVEMIEERDNDYYSDTTSAKWRCDFEKLLEFIKL